MANPYEIAIHLSMQNTVSPVLAVIAKDMLGLQMSAKKLEDAFAKVGTGLKLAVGGAAAIMGGVEIVKGLAELAEKGQELLHQKNMLVRAGASEAQVNHLVADSFERVSRAIPTATAAEYLKTVNELRSVTGDMNKATDAAIPSLKIDALLSNAKGTKVEGEGFKLWRALEMKGITANNPALTQTLMGALMRDILGSGGKIDAGTFMAMAKTGGASWINASQDFLAGPGAVIAGDLGGDRAGTAMMTLYQLLNGATTISHQQFDALKKAGLIDPSKTHNDKGGRINIDPGAIAGSLQYSGDLFGWAQSIKPALEKASGGDPKVFEALLAKIGRNRNATKLLEMFMDDGFVQQIRKDQALWGQVMGVDDAYMTMFGKGGSISPRELEDPMQAATRQREAANAAKNNPDYGATMEALTKQWNNLWAAVGGPVAKAAIPMLQNLTDAFTKIGAWANEHPERVKVFAEAIAAIAAAMIGIGAAAVVAAAVTIAGPITVAVTAIGFAITTLAALNWNAVTAGFDALLAAIHKLFASEAIGLGKIPDKDIGVPYTLPEIVAAYARQNGPGGFRADPEAARGRAYHQLIPNITVNDPTKVTVNVTLDGRAIAAAVSTQIVKENRAVGSSAEFDGRAQMASPGTWDR